MFAVISRRILCAITCRKLHHIFLHLCIYWVLKKCINIYFLIYPRCKVLFKVKKSRRSCHQLLALGQNHEVLARPCQPRNLSALMIWRSLAWFAVSLATWLHSSSRTCLVVVGNVIICSTASLRQWRDHGSEVFLLNMSWFEILERLGQHSYHDVAYQHQWHEYKK